MSRRRLLKLGVPLAVLALAAAALGYWTLSALGTASGSVGTLNPPTGVGASADDSTVSVGWTESNASGGAVAPQGYHVTRTNTATNETSPACGSSPANLISAASCEDTSVPDGTYTYTVTAVYRSWTAVSDASAATSVEAAFTPPHTSATLTPEPNGAGWLKENVRVDLEASPGTSPVESITYSTSGAQTTQSTTEQGSSASLQVTAEGVTSVHFHATDTAGHEEEEQTQTVKVDKSPPTTTDDTAAIGPGAKNTTQTVTLSPSDNQSSDASGIDKTYYTTDGSTPAADGAGSPQGTTQVYDPQSKIQLSAEGSHTIKYFSVDRAGNTEAVKTAATAVKIDKSAPQPAVTSPAQGAVALPNPTVGGTAGTASDDAGTVTVRLYPGTSAGGTPVQTLSGVAVNQQSGAWSTPTSGLSAGNTYTAQVTQADAAGNSGAGTSTFRVSSVTVGAPADGGWVRTLNPIFTGKASANTTVSVAIYAGSSATGTPYRTLSASPSGSGGSFDWSTTYPSNGAQLSNGQTYTVQATQTVGTTTSTSSANTFTVDTTAPTVTLTSPAAASRTNDTTPTLAGTGGNAAGDSNEVAVKVYSGGSATGTPVRTLTATRSGTSWSVDATPALPDGTYTFQASQDDAAGNTGTSAARTFTVDSTPPSVTSINRSSASPTKATSVSWTVSMSESVTGVGASDFELHKTGSVAATLGTVSGSGQTYTVTATGVSGTGDLQLKLVDDDSITDAATNPLGGPGAGNGSFDGQTYAIDNTAPDAPAITSPADGSYRNTGSFSVSGTAEPHSTITVRDGGTALSGAVTADAGGNWSKALTNVSQGSHTYTATAQDAVGNTSQSSNSRTVTVDTQAPAVAITAPTANSFTQNRTPTISGTAGNATTPSPDSGTVTVKLYQGSTASGEPQQTMTPTRTGTSWSATPASLADGTYTVQASQDDAAGNTGTSTAVTFTVDNQSPSGTSAWSTANGGATAGKVEQGDSITFQFDEAIDPASVLSGWTNATLAQNVWVKLADNGADDVITICAATDTSCSTPLPLGRVNLGGNYINSGTALFQGSGSGQKSSVVGNAQKPTQITVTLGLQSSGGTLPTQSATSQAVWSQWGFNDLAGNSASGSASATQGSAQKQF